MNEHIRTALRTDWCDLVHLSRASTKPTGHTLTLVHAQDRAQEAKVLSAKTHRPDRAVRRFLLTFPDGRSRLPAMDGWPTRADGTRLAGLAYGGDYNPEQWPRETWP